MTAGHDTSRSQQPPTGPGVSDRVRAVMAAHRERDGALLPALHAVQGEIGCIPPEAVPVIADELNLSRADVHGVISFYRDFRTEPPGRTVARICRAEACQAVGAEELVAATVDRLGLAVGGTSPDGALTLDEVFCLGNCALGPSVQLGSTVLGRMDAARLIDVLSGAASDPAPVARVGAGAAKATAYVSRDTAARSVGADDVAERLAAAAGAGGHDLRLVRTGTRGLLWLEPVIEVAGPDGRRWGYGPVGPEDVEALIAAGLLTGAPEAVEHPLALGPVEELPWLQRQQRITFARVGVVDPQSADDYLAHGGMAGLARALQLPPERVVEEVTASGLRGRGGAGFPAGTSGGRSRRRRGRAQVRLLQRRRGRQRHLRRPDAARGRPVLHSSRAC